MWKQALGALTLVAFAFAVLLISVFRTASVKYGFNPNQERVESVVLGVSDVHIQYPLPYPGRILPDSPLWSLKALRDNLWLLINTDPTKEAELKLLFADKRIGSALLLFEKGDYSQGFSSLTKAEKYLEEASVQIVGNKSSGIESTDLFTRLAGSALKHYEVTNTLLVLAPNEVKPLIINIQEYPKRVFEVSRNSLLETGSSPPENPFDWD